MCVREIFPVVATIMIPLLLSSWRTCKIKLNLPISLRSKYRFKDSQTSFVAALGAEYSIEERSVSYTNIKIVYIISHVMKCPVLFYSNAWIVWIEIL